MENDLDAGVLLIEEDRAEMVLLDDDADAAALECVGGDSALSLGAVAAETFNPGTAAAIKLAQIHLRIASLRLLALP